MVTLFDPDPDRLHDELVQDIDEEFRLEERDRRGPPYDSWSNPDIYSQAQVQETAEHESIAGKARWRRRRSLLRNRV